KVFPGQLELSKVVYHPKMEDKNSEEFKNTSNKITAELTITFNKTEGFSNVTVVKIEPLPEQPSPSRVVRESGIQATVDIIFNTAADVTTDSVVEIMKNATDCDNCLLAGATFDDTDLCKNQPCDEVTTSCTSKNGEFNCQCHEHYIKTNMTNRLCIACPSGFRAVDSETCTKCSFGRSGLNCKDSWQLALVIVGTVLGGLFIISVIVLPLVTSRSIKKKAKKNQNAESGNPYARHFPASSPAVVGDNSQASTLNGLTIDSDGGVTIPRARVGESLYGMPDDEMVPGTSRQNLTPVERNPSPFDDEADINIRPQNSPNAQIRPRNNPLTVNRPQVNLYGQSQGHTNPSFIPDNGRSFN
ncbi:hypothetical protein JOB18_010641, partial [Solea senegalensis]